ncbi:LLM class flavin-dependent oxidoreductase [Streptomyces antimycoticus]|uniref:LLM class flavin-dependent oxidoreductase n=1 Tax=Streptomyces antimycoticus TaxID=68175 RepID=UPI00368C004C
MPAKRALGLSSTGGVGQHRLTAAARTAEECGFDGVWLLDDRTEDIARPNPAIVAALIAVSTSSIRVGARLLAGPGDDALRAAEHWSVVDNLSNGRLALFSDTPGEAHHRTVRDLWEGQEVRRPGPGGQDYVVRAFPPPCQARFPLWLMVRNGDQVAERVRHLSEEPMGVSVLADGLKVPRSVHDAAHEVVYRLDVEAAGDHLLEDITKLAGAHPA